MSMDEGIDTVYGKVCLRKIQKERRKFLLGELLQDFARNTTLHGLRYITERGVTIIDKIFWLILFLVSVSICSYQIRNVWVKWETTPVIVSINDRLVPVSEVPFPSVTICPQWKISTWHYNYTKEAGKARQYGKNSNMSVDDAKRFEDVSLICDTYKILLDRKYSDVELVENINKAMRIDRSELHISWQGRYAPKTGTVNKVYTREGICYSFNALAAEDMFRTEQIQKNYSYIDTKNRVNKWSMEGGYEGDSFNDTYPRRGRQNGADPDLVILLVYSEYKSDKECNPMASGYKVYLNHPADMPQTSLYYYALNREQTSSFALKYSVVATSDEVKYYTPEVRHCYFPRERYLRYFRIYTENNCRIECLSNHTYNMCGCVDFYMPHNTSDRICTIQSKDCMISVKEKLAEKEMAGISSSLCNCLPACNTVEYDAEILKSMYHHKEYILNHVTGDAAAMDFLKTNTFSKLEMYFKSPRFVSMRRSELFGLTDFIANSGGLLGLFLGFSFLSLVEIIYFLTIRIWRIFKRDLDEAKLENRKKKIKDVYSS